MPLTQQNYTDSAQKVVYDTSVLKKLQHDDSPTRRTEVVVSPPPTCTATPPAAAVPPAAEGEHSALTPDPKTHVKAAAQCVAGGISAGFSMVFVYPLDVVKTKLQTFGHLYEGGLHSLVVEWRAGGTRAIYRGLTPAVLGAGVESCFHFTSFGVWQDVVRALAQVESTEQMSRLQNTLAGNMTGVSVSLMMTPIEFVKCRQQALREVALQEKGPGRPPGSYPTPSQLALHIYRQEGVRGLYRGYVGVLTKMVPGYGAMFGTYDVLRSYFAKEGQTKDQIGDLRHLVSGAAAGVAYWTVAYPLDLVKVRMQVNPNMNGANKGDGFYRLLFRALRTEGILALYNGFSLTALRAVIAFSITFPLYERIRRRLIEIHGSLT